MAKANFERAKTQFPSTGMGEDDWVAVFDANPDVMWQILGDVYNVIRDEQERDEGRRRIGRRPVRAAGSIDELRRTTIPPQFSNDAFPVALKALMGSRSQRQFAPRVPITQPALSRLLSGDVKPDLALLERIAAAGKVPPYFFVEWRAQFLAEMVARVLQERPHLGISAYKRYRATERTLE